MYSKYNTHIFLIYLKETLRTALAMGADRAMHVEYGQEDYSDLGPLAVANMLAKIIQKEDINLVILGKQVCLGREAL